MTILTKKLFFLIIVLSIMLFSFSQRIMADPFTYKKMAFIHGDPKSNNLVFRGNKPVIYDSNKKDWKLRFASDNPLFSSACSAKNISKHCYHLIDVSLMHNRDDGKAPTEGQLLLTEYQHFLNKQKIHLHPRHTPYIKHIKNDTEDAYGNHIIYFPLKAILLTEYPYGGICRHVPRGVKQSWRDACRHPNESMLTAMMEETGGIRGRAPTGRTLDDVVQLIEAYEEGKLPKTTTSWHQSNQQLQHHPSIIYFHCRHGLNRTGVVHAAYLLHKQYELANSSKPVPTQLSLQQIIDRVLHTLPGFSKMHPRHINTIVWYCAYLNMKLAKHHKPYHLNCNYKIQVHGHRAKFYNRHLGGGM